MQHSRDVIELWATLAVGLDAYSYIDICTEKWDKTNIAR